MCVSVLLSPKAASCRYALATSKSHVPSVSFDTVLGGGDTGEIFTQRFNIPDVLWKNTCQGPSVASAGEYYLQLGTTLLPMFLKNQMLKRIQKGTLINLKP